MGKLNTEKYYSVHLSDWPYQKHKVNVKVQSLSDLMEVY